MPACHIFSAFCQDAYFMLLICYFRHYVFFACFAAAAATRGDYFHAMLLMLPVAVTLRH